LTGSVCKSVASFGEVLINVDVCKVFSVLQTSGLKLDNTKLKADIDALEQYGRRELIRFSGIVEKPGENTTDIVRNIVKSVDKDLPEGDIIRSHRKVFSVLQTSGLNNSSFGCTIP
jgi:hypothetical protein